MIVSELKAEGKTHNEALKVQFGMLIARKMRSVGKAEGRLCIVAYELDDYDMKAWTVLMK